MSTRSQILFSLLLILSLLTTTASAYSRLSQPQHQTKYSLPERQQISGLDSVLSQLVIIYETEGIQPALEFAQRRHLSIDGDRVQVTAYAYSDDIQEVENVKSAILEVGGEVQTWWRARVQAMVPIGNLRELADRDAVRYVRNPLRPELDVTTEGDAAVNADDYRNVVGTSGEGIKIAILDLGFQGYPGLQSSGELPSDATVKSFRSDGVIDGVTVHGAACAEIVYDMAASATFYFVNYGTDTEYYNAVDYLESEGINVVSHSISWFQSGPYDGTSDISQRIDTARSNGIFWANSAGNRAKQHWEGYFSNDGSGNHIWDSGSGDTINSLGSLDENETVTAYLSWDNWNPYGTNDYDLYLMYYNGSTWVTETSSTNDQSSGSIPPTEDIVYDVPTSGTYGILVKKVSGTDQYLELFTTRQDLNYPVAMGSIPNAGDAAGAITVGAVWVFNYSENGLEAFSSHGPTNATGGGEPDYNNGSYTKPDIAGPDGVSTSTYGTWGFYGTSASTPHTAGAAALYMSGYNNSYGGLPTVDQTQEYLENCAEATYDWGSDSDGIKNNQFGAGGLYMCETPTVLTQLEFSASPSTTITPGALVAVASFLLVSSGLYVFRQKKER